MIYEYRCIKCNHIEEVEMKMTDEHPISVMCTKCRSLANRYFSVSPIIPEHMKAEAGNQIRYDRSSQIHGKKYF